MWLRVRVHGEQRAQQLVNDLLRTSQLKIEERLARKKKEEEEAAAALLHGEAMNEQDKKPMSRKEKEKARKKANKKSKKARDGPEDQARPQEDE